jgi:hypothetical protein
LNKEKIQTFLCLTNDNKILLFKVFFLLWVISLGMRLSLKFLLKVLNTIYLKPLLHGVEYCPPERIAWAVRVTSQYVPKATCLAQALATQVLLAQGGKYSEISIGVAKGEKSPLEAHAWVEMNDSVLIGGGQIDHYTLITSLKRKER